MCPVASEALGIARDSEISKQQKVGPKEGNKSKVKTKDRSLFKESHMTLFKILPKRNMYMTTFNY